MSSNTGNVFILGNLVSCESSEYVTSPSIFSKKAKHLIDIINPDKDYSVYNFQIDFINSYKQISKNNKRCIICGGTGLYIESLLLNYDLSNRPPPNQKLRKKLSKKSIEDLETYLKKINNDDIKKFKLDTKNRIIRNIEICLDKTNSANIRNNLLPIKNYTVIGINPGRDKVRDNITQRLKDRFENGLIQEVESLLKNNVTHDRLNYFGLEYRFISQYLNEMYSKEELFQKLNSAIHQFSKKQMTFFRYMEKNNIKIHWIKKNYFQSSINLVEDYLNESKNI